MTDERLKIVFGFAILGGLLVLCAVIALGKVREDTSFGLREIITGLLMLSAGFANWAFGSISKHTQGNGDSDDKK